MSNPIKVLVTCPPMLRQMDQLDQIFESAGAVADRAKTVQVMTEEELIALLPAYDGWIIGDDPATHAVLSAGMKGRLKAAVKWGVGVDNVDFAAAKQLSLTVVNTPGVFGREVADVAMGYVIGLARETFAIDRSIRENGWPKPAGISLAGKTVALVGFGDIGRQTARRLLASDMDIIVYDPAYAPDQAFPVTGAKWPDRLSDADFIVFTAPLNDATRGMFDETILPNLKRGVRVVNVGRGPLISEAALVRGLRDGQIHSAALDVFECEPLPVNSVLREFPRCIFGSHNASNTQDAVLRVSHLAIDLLFESLGLAIGKA
jgi:D-3-phosphoglycerate dehydrogenase